MTAAPSVSINCLTLRKVDRSTQCSFCHIAALRIRKIVATRRLHFEHICMRACVANNESDPGFGGLAKKRWIRSESIKLCDGGKKNE